MKIDFHVLEDASGLASLKYACQVIENAHQANEIVYVQTNTLAEAEKLNDLLWTYRDDSFIPHAIYDPTDATPPPILIGYAETLAQSAGLLINLSNEIPPFYQQFDRIIEIVFSDPVVQQLARNRFKQYRDLGHELNTHKTRVV